MPSITSTVESFIERALEFTEGMPKELRAGAIVNYVQACAAIDAARRTANSLDDIAESLTEIAYLIKRGMRDADQEPIDGRSAVRDGA